MLDADFVDVFQVRGVARQKHGQYYKPVVSENGIAFYYRGLDGVMRETLVKVSPKPTEIQERTVRWELRLEPLKRVELDLNVTPLVEGRKSRAQIYEMDHQLRQRRANFARWEAASTNFQTRQRCPRRVAEDGSRRFPRIADSGRRGAHYCCRHSVVRDDFRPRSIIAAYQSLSLNSQLAVDTLRVLARYQGKEYNDWRDEEPGKILHEYRDGEMTRDGEMPFGPYYGSIDATPLFLILLSETFNWTADEQLVEELLPNAYAALEWIDKYGDLDDDGFVEYQRRSPKGLDQPGMEGLLGCQHASRRTVAKTPIALCEVQGYVYDAKYRMSSLLRTFGDVKTADRLKRESAELAKRFDRAFWVPSRGFYAMALDAEKKPLEVISSNPGHLLFTRIINRERARVVSNRLMRDDMFSGWGWRTMSQEERVFNPLSYHRGSVWPHDNSIIAHGMALNDMRDGALRILTSLYQAASNFRDYRLPELFCGVQRREYDEPVHYPVSCSPQAWASGAMFLILSRCWAFIPARRARN